MRNQDKTKTIEARYFLFAYRQLIEAMWYLLCNKGVSFKRFLIELSDVCTTMANNEERNAGRNDLILFVDSYP